MGVRERGRLEEVWKKSLAMGKAKREIVRGCGGVKGCEKGCKREALRCLEEVSINDIIRERTRIRMAV